MTQVQILRIQQQKRNFDLKAEDDGRQLTSCLIEDLEYENAHELVSSVAEVPCMHAVFLCFSRCYATSYAGLHQENRAVAIAVAAQPKEAENSAPSGRELGIVQGDIRANRTGKATSVSTDLV